MDTDRGLAHRHQLPGDYRQRRRHPDRHLGHQLFRRARHRARGHRSTDTGGRRQVPTIDGYASGLRRVAPYAVADLEQAFVEDLRGQFHGKPPHTQKVVDPDPAVPAAYHSQDTIDFFTHVPAGTWSNEITVQSTRRARSYEPGRWIARVSPTPLLMIVATEDTTAPTDLALNAYEQALEPKSLHLITGGHYSPYQNQFDESCTAATQWFTQHLATPGTRR